MDASALPQAIELARTGHKQEARALLEEILSASPTNETAWIWLADCAATPQERIAVLEQCVAANPQASKARAGLDLLRKRFPAVTAPLTPPDAPEQFDQPSKPFAWQYNNETAFPTAEGQQNAVFEEAAEAPPALGQQPAAEDQPFAHPTAVEPLEAVEPAAPEALAWDAEPPAAQEEQLPTDAPVSAWERAEAVEGEADFSALDDSGEALDLSGLWADTASTEESAAETPAAESGPLAEFHGWSEDAAAVDDRLAVDLPESGTPEDASAVAGAVEWWQNRTEPAESAEEFQWVSTEPEQASGEPAAEPPALLWESDGEAAVAAADEVFAASEGEQPAAAAAEVDDELPVVAPFTLEDVTTADEWAAAGDSPALPADDDDFLSSLLAEEDVDRAANEALPTGVASDYAMGGAPVSPALEDAAPDRAVTVEADSAVAAVPAAAAAVPAVDAAPVERQVPQRKKRSNAALFILLLIIGVLGIAILVLGLLIARTFM